MIYVEVILPLPLSGTFTYRIPKTWNIQPQSGMRLLVPFGQKKIYTGIIHFVHSTPPEQQFVAREAICILDETPIVHNTQLRLWEWIATYYMTTLGEVYRAALPSAMKMESETKVRINEDFVADTKLTARQQQLLDLLNDSKWHTVTELTKQLDINSAWPALNRLAEIDAVQVDEYITERYRPKTETFLSLHKRFTEKEQLQPIFSELGRSPKQLALLMHYLDLSDFLKTNHAKEIAQKTLLSSANSTTTILKHLVDKQILQVTKHQIDRLSQTASPSRKAFQLNKIQQNALEKIENLWCEKATVLLHGVTSSGKTEVYIHLIQKVLAQGKQVLYLVPEIALTTQLTTRLQAVFGNLLGVYHSKYSDAERVEVYQNLLQNKGYQLILGVRSSIFLPFKQLGLIIVDEEHDSSYKQQDPAPRYHARNVATILAQMHSAKTLLGTATPAVESYFNAKIGKFGLVEMPHRYKDIRLPIISVVNTQEAYRKKQMTDHFSDELVEKMKLALAQNEQIILFQNRRGYAPYLECKACNSVPRCMNCDVSLTVHKQKQILICHYCGYTMPLPHKCPACGNDSLTDRGFGTEKVEDEIQQLFPESRVARMDLDTTRTRNAYQKLINDFENHKIDILVGTQMVSKGLNFDDVSLVAVLNADNLLNQPDFRSYERAFQMLEQVSGRAGRAHKQGEVVLQTSNPENLVIKQVVAHNYIEFYSQQIAERKQFRYPPYFRLLQIVIKHRDSQKLEQLSAMLASRLQQIFGNRCSQVIVPIVSRIQNQYIRQILLRVEMEAPTAKAKALLQTQIQHVRQTPAGKSALIYVDVDPM